MTIYICVYIIYIYMYICIYIYMYMCVFDGIGKLDSMGMSPNINGNF